MFEWCARFRSGRQSVGDDVRARELRTAITDQNISQVVTCILVDRRVTVREIANELSLSVGTVETIIHERLKFSKVSARWISKQLTDITYSFIANCQTAVFAQE